jgi:hypothetical protein
MRTNSIGQGLRKAIPAAPRLPDFGSEPMRGIPNALASRSPGNPDYDNAIPAHLASGRIV